MKWTKNLTYPDEAFRRNVVPLMAADPTCPTDAMLEVALLFRHQKQGVQLVVPHSATEAFLTFKPQYKFEDYPWPAPTIELYFEHPDVPTILGAYLNGADLSAMGFSISEAAGIDRDIPDTHVLLQEQSGQGFTIQTRYTLEDMNDVIRRGSDFENTTSMRAEDGFDGDDAHMLGLAACFLYRAIAICGEGHAQHIESKKDMKHGGKHGVRGRPKLDAFFIWPPADGDED
jgi:hypothetical protein